MSPKERTPAQAAKDLIEMLNVGSDEISISTQWKAPNSISLKVFIYSGNLGLRHKIPAYWEGYSVTCEVTSRPEASFGH